jgi:hypothetical protein
VHLVGRHQQDANWQHASCVSTKMRDNYWLTWPDFIPTFILSEPSFVCVFHDQ